MLQQPLGLLVVANDVRNGPLAGLVERHGADETIGMAIGSALGCQGSDRLRQAFGALTHSFDRVAC